MRTLIGIMLLIFCGHTVLADSLVCTSAGTTVPCSSSPLSIIANFPVVDISGNTLTASTNVDFSVGSATLPFEGVTASASVNDVFGIPYSAAGDVLKVSAFYGVFHFDADPGSALSFSFQIGPGSTSSPEVDLNPYIQPPAYCPPAGEPIACVFSGTLPASAFSFLAIQGDATLVANNGSSPSADVSFDGNFTISRFLADGTTPDPFTPTPEPSSLALALAGLGVFGFLKFRSRFIIQDRRE